MIVGHQISQELLSALGLPMHTCSFTLRCEADKIVTVECEYYPGGSFQAALAQYYMVPRPVETAAPQHPAEIRGYDAWLRERTERAHAEFMERTSRRLRCDWSTEDVARYLGVPIN